MISQNNVDFFLWAQTDFLVSQKCDTIIYLITCIYTLMVVILFVIEVKEFMFNMRYCFIEYKMFYEPTSFFGIGNLNVVIGRLRVAN